MRRTRPVIKIDEEKCDGCGLCVTACAEGALKVIDGKARLVSEVYCDGLGACLGECPRGALTVEEREADEFSEEAVHALLSNTHGAPQVQAAVAARTAPHGAHQHGFGGCPGAAQRTLSRPQPGADAAPGAAGPSQLGNWPVQLHLAPVNAPYFQGARLLLCADCVPFAVANFHGSLLAGRTLLVGCPKLDDGAFYAEKLGRILQHNEIASLEVAIMEVPCCSGMAQIARQALAQSGKTVPADVVRYSLQGELLQRFPLDGSPW